MSDIFVSYTTPDTPRVKLLVDVLRQQGWSVWWDRTILPGQTWEQVIETALTDARCVIVIWSLDSVQSDWVRIEADDARQRGILLPVLLDDVRVPLAFRGMQAARLVDWSGAATDPDFQGLCSAVSEMVGHRSRATATTEVRPLPHELARGDIVRQHDGGRDYGNMEPPQTELIKQRITSLDPVKERAEERETASANLSPAQRSHIESAVYNRARPRDQWVRTVLQDFRETVEPQENPALIAVLKSLADSKLLLIGKWDRLGAHEMYPCGLTDDEMFCQGYFEIMVTKQNAPKFKRRLQSGA